MQEEYIIEKLKEKLPDKEFEFVIHNDNNGWGIKVLTVDGVKYFPKWEAVGLGTPYNTDDMSVDDVFIQAYMESIVHSYAKAIIEATE